MTAIVIVAFAAHVVAWIALPASKGNGKTAQAATATVSHASPAVQMSGA